MNDRCHDVDLFFDRELGSEAAHAFRDHLTTCARCQRALHGRMMEHAVILAEQSQRTQALTAPARQAAEASAPAGEARGADVPVQLAVLPSDRESSTGAQQVVDDAAPLPPAYKVSREGGHRVAWLLRSRPSWVAVVGLAAVALVWLAVRPSPSPQRYAVGALPTMPSAVPSPPRLALAAKRGVEVRFTAPALDHYRPLAGDAAVESPVDRRPLERITQQDLSRLEAHGDVHALIGALALNGELNSAKSRADELAGNDATALSDGAALALLDADNPAVRQDAAAREATLQRALSLAAAALRLAPMQPQAMWNEALALRELRLPLVAANVFDQIASRHEAGWSAEARGQAKRLRDRDRAEQQAWQQANDEATAMERGGPLMRSATIDQVPSMARDELYYTLASAAKPEQIDRLAGFAAAIDQRFATHEPSALVGHVRHSDLRARAPLAAAFAQALAIDDELARNQRLDELRARASNVAPDIARATLLARNMRLLSDDEAAVFTAMAADREPWWQLLALEHLAYAAHYHKRDDVAVDVLAQRAARICATTNAARCGSVATIAGAASGQVGRFDLALRQLTEARATAYAEHQRKAEDSAIYSYAQTVADRISDDIDASAVASAYVEEYALRKPGCQPPIKRLELVASEALRYHRYEEAARARDGSDDLRAGCPAAVPMFNGAQMRLQLLDHEPAAHAVMAVANQRRYLDQLAAVSTPDYQHNLEMLRAVVTLRGDRAPGISALREVLDHTRAPDTAATAQARARAFDALIEAEAADGHGDAVLTLMAERLGVASGQPCVLGVASWNRLIVAARDANGEIALDSREVPAGQIIVPPAAVVSVPLRDRLAACHDVKVLTAGAYFGAPRLLPDDLAWSYASPRAAVHKDPPAATAPRELVVSDVVPPSQLHLPDLPRFTGSEQATWLSGPRATPAAVVEQMKDASLVVIVAHGQTDARDPFAASLVLSPDAGGDYLLTASKLRSLQLRNAPAVILAGCDAGRVQVSDEPWSLATSLIHAGARMVIAPTEKIPDDDINAVFGPLLDQLRNGADPAQAVLKVRQIADPKDLTSKWRSSIVVFNGYR